MFRTVISLLLAGFISLPLKADTLTVVDAQQRVVELHSALHASEAQWQAASQRIAQAQALPEPQLRLGLANLPSGSFSLDQDPMSQLQLAISQPLPYPGKLATREVLAERQADVVSASHDGLKQQLLMQAAQQWWRLFAIEKAQQILLQNRTLLRQLVTITQTKYKVGEGLQQDVLLAQLELSKLIDRELYLKGEQQAARYALNRLMSQPLDATIILAEPDSGSLPLLLPIKKLQQLAEQHPLLQGQKAQVAVARQQHHLVEQDYRPDFQLSAQYGFREGRDDLVSLQLSMNLPIYSSQRQDPLLSQRNSELKQQQYQLQNLQQQLQSNIAVKYARYQQLRSQVGLLYDGILPQARQTVDSMQVGYQVNKVDFLNLARSQQTLYEYETQYWQMFSDAQQLLAQLQAEVAVEKIYE